MNKWEKIGKHLDIPIYISLLEKIDDIKKEDFSSSVVLLYFGNDSLDASQIDDFFNNILGTMPLAVHFAGKNSDKYFALIFDNKILNKNKKHTMTYVTEDNKTSRWMSDFFYSSWPSEDRFDEWKDHRIIVIGNSALYSKLCKKIPEFLESSIKN